MPPTPGNSAMTQPLGGMSYAQVVKSGQQDNTLCRLPGELRNLIIGMISQTSLSRLLQANNQLHREYQEELIFIDIQTRTFKFVFHAIERGNLPALHHADRFREMDWTLDLRSPNSTTYYSSPYFSVQPRAINFITRAVAKTQQNLHEVVSFLVDRRVKVDLNDIARLFPYPVYPSPFPPEASWLRRTNRQLCLLPVVKELLKGVRGPAADANGPTANELDWVASEIMRYQTTSNAFECGCGQGKDCDRQVACLLLTDFPIQDLDMTGMAVRMITDYPDPLPYLPFVDLAYTRRREQGKTNHPHPFHQTAIAHAISRLHGWGHTRNLDEVITLVKYLAQNGARVDHPVRPLVTIAIGDYRARAMSHVYSWERNAAPFADPARADEVYALVECLLEAGAPANINTSGPVRWGCMLQGAVYAGLPRLVPLLIRHGAHDGQSCWPCEHSHQYGTRTLRNNWGGLMEAVMLNKPEQARECLSNNKKFPSGKVWKWPIKYNFFPKLDGCKHETFNPLLMAMRLAEFQDNSEMIRLLAENTGCWVEEPCRTCRLTYNKLMEEKGIDQSLSRRGACLRGWDKLGEESEVERRRLKRLGRTLSD